MSEPPLIDFVIADWQTPHLAAAAVASLERCEVPYTVKVVDAFELKLSYAEAINGGVEGGSAPIVCALNADVECRGSQEAVVGLFSDPQVAVVGPLQVNAAGKIVHGGIFGTNKAPAHRWWQEPVEFHEPEVRELVRDAVTVSGSVYFARRSVWERLGGFLLTPHFYEETWFSYVARHEGYRVVYTGAVEWLHLWDSSPLTDDQKRERFLESQAIFRAACEGWGIECD